ncbi:MAG: SlyX family protein [Spirochaetes bacterium]|nr:SlyX family protein [Spirochaetota bacterium]MBU0954437.1 SlyX family protein [Spirochaetota bacterium]
MNDKIQHDLEVRFAWQEQTIADLSSQVYEHQQRLARLEALLEQMVERLKHVDPEQSAAELPDERPPHY